MRNLIIGSLTGSVAAFAIMAAIDDSQEYIDGLNRVKTMAIETQQIISRKENALAKQSSALENLVAGLKDQMNTVKSELSDLRSDQATFRIEREKIESVLLAQIRAEHQSVGSTSNHSSSSAEITHDEVDLTDVQANSYDGAIDKTDRLMALDDAMNAQAPDPAWDNHAAGELSDSFHSEDFAGSQLESVACRGSMCRLEIYHEDRRASNAWLEEEHQLVPWSHKGRIETIEDGSGKPVTVMYITRNGYDFPGES